MIKEHKALPRKINANINKRKHFLQKRPYHIGSEPKKTDKLV